jgi:hypothetical protein
LIERKEWEGWDCEKGREGGIEERKIREGCRNEDGFTDSQTNRDE